mgnify:CR=1 FL=1
MRRATTKLCLPAVIDLTRVDSSRNLWRYYYLSLEADFFASLRFTRKWGRIGSRGGRSVVMPFEDESQACDELNKYALAKIKKGYRIKSISPCLLEFDSLFEDLAERQSLTLSHITSAGLGSIHPHNKRLTKEALGQPED